MLENQCETEQAKNRKCLMKNIQNLRFCALQNIALRSKVKKNSNFYQLAELRALDDKDFKKWIGKDRGNYMHYECQNELLTIMGNRLQREHIVKPIQKGFLIKMSSGYVA